MQCKCVAFCIVKCIIMILCYDVAKHYNTNVFLAAPTPGTDSGTEEPQRPLPHMPCKCVAFLYCEMIICYEVAKHYNTMFFSQLQTQMMKKRSLCTLEKARNVSWPIVIFAFVHASIFSCTIAYQSSEEDETYTRPKRVK